MNWNLIKGIFSTTNWVIRAISTKPVRILNSIKPSRSMLIRDMRPPHLISFQRVLVRTLSPSLPILHKMGVNLAVLISFRTVLEKKLQMMAR